MDDNAILDEDSEEYEIFQEILAGTWDGENHAWSGFCAQQYAETLTGDKLSNTVSDWLILNFTPPKNPNKLDNPGAKIYAVYQGVAGKFLIHVKPIGVTLLILYFLLALLEKATSDNFTVEMGVKMLVKLVAGYALMNLLLPTMDANGNYNGDGLIITVMNLFTGISYEAEQEIGITYGNYKLVRSIAEGPWNEALLWYTRTLAPWLVRGALKIVAVGTAISRVFEAAILVTFAPIGVANLFNGAQTQFSSGIRYFKKVAVISLQGVIIHASLIAIQVLTLSNGTANGITNLAIMFAGCSFIAKSKSIANEIINP